MLPRWHIFLGILFSLLIWITYPRINPLLIGLVLFASIFIDFDHYTNAVMKTKSWSLGKAFEYHRQRGRETISEYKRGIKRKGDFHLFHTLEFHILIGALGFLWIGFFYLFIGMVFHSLLDVFSLIYADRLYRREYFLFNWFFIR